MKGSLFMTDILAIDDEEGILSIIKSALEKNGHKVNTISNPLTISDNEYMKYDLILLDVMMPEIDGFSLCRKIRGLVDCPIIFLTAKEMCIRDSDKEMNIKVHTVGNAQVRLIRQRPLVDWATKWMEKNRK